MLDPEVERQIAILKTKVRTMESRLEASEKANKLFQAQLHQLSTKLQEAGEFSLKLAHQIQILGS